MTKDALSRFRPAFRAARERVNLSREALASLAMLNVNEPDVTIDYQRIEYLESRCRRLPARKELEPIAMSLGWTWLDVLRLL